MPKLALLFSSSLCLAGLLIGCGVDTSAIDTSSRGTLNFVGEVHGGQQPVDRSTIQLYTVGSAGNGSAARAMITGTTVKTDSNGYFSLSSGSGASATYDYTCTNATDQVYIAATGGNPGLAANTNNAALVMMAALGNCGNLNASTFISINEITTVAAAWALAPFMASYDHIGASATNSEGIANAMLDAQVLANSGNGLPATLSSNLTVETGKLLALADVIATCINSNGGSACNPLFTAAKPTAGSSPTDTLTAALDIVRNPGQNPAGVFNVISSTPPFPTTLTAAPNDWTMTMTVTGGGLNAPTSLDIDSKGNVWVAGYYGELSEFSPQGRPLSGTGFTAGGALYESYGLTIDTNGNVWVASQQSSANANGLLSRFVPNPAGGISSYANFHDSTTNFPVALTADTNGSIFFANYANSTTTSYTSAGAVQKTGLGSGHSAFPVAVAADSNHGVWIANSEDTTITHVAANGTLISALPCCYGSNGLATDSAGNVWVANYYGDSFSVVSSNPAATPQDATVINQGKIVGTGYNSYPAGVAVDAAQNVWIANYRGQSISELAGYKSSSALGTILSPASGYGYPTDPTATTSLLLLPYGVVPDASGNLWISDFGNSNLVMFFGLATPTKMPVQPIPVAP